MVKRNCWMLLIALALASGAGLARPAPARGENLGPGGGTRIIVGDEVVGPYRLLVTAAPEPAQVGAVTYVVRVSDPASGEKVRDADVAIELVHGEKGIRLTTAATHANAGNAIDYAAHMEVADAGSWNGVVQVSGRAGSAQVAFVQRIAPPRGVATVVIVAVPFVITLAVLGGFWVFRTGRRADPAETGSV
ncbi:MAG: hypothetical protein FJ011_08070 [Chloroflexi bacterium]|nr:hypothetical protein [Chloroflexota bacterium]